MAISQWSANSHEEAEEAALILAQERAASEEKPRSQESPGIWLSYLLSGCMMSSLTSWHNTHRPGY